MTSSGDREVRVRVAPSPTGDPHVGTAYVALFNYALARRSGGSFVLRIEDTDRERSDPGSERMIFDSLRWLGLQWDEGPDVGGPFGPYRQSERTDLYRRHCERIVESGRAYRCFCTRERLEELRASQRAAKVSRMGYDGLCRSIDPDEASRRAASGEPHVIRLAMPLDGTTSVTDLLRGEIEFENAQMDDQVLLKSDGYPTYHLANVVDDHLMGITHIIRAEEWINSLPKHMVLYEAFGWEPPVFCHLPLLRNRDKSKISKRKNPVSLNYYRRAGFLPEAMLNYLARMGWAMPDGSEEFTLEEFVERFSLEQIVLGGPVFDYDKLLWLNGRYLRKLDAPDFLQRLRGGILSDDYLERVIPLVRERIDKLEDFVDYGRFFFAGDVEPGPQDLPRLVANGTTATETRKVLRMLLEEFLDPLMDWNPATLESRMRELCDRTGWKPGDLFMPVRVAVTGASATPPLFETMAVLGKEVCRNRIRKAMKTLGAMEGKS